MRKAYENCEATLFIHSIERTPDDSKAIAITRNRFSHVYVVERSGGSEILPALCLKGCRLEGLARIQFYVDGIGYKVQAR